jgi:hypothetical protein
VRFWGEPPLVREPDLALFGVARLDPAEEQLLTKSPLRCFHAADVQRVGAAAAAQSAVERIHANGYEFILHFDVDVIADFQATNYPGTGGLALDEVRQALEVFVTQKHLAAIEVTAYNPTKDPDSNAAKVIVELLGSVLEKRLEALRAAAETASAKVAASAASAPQSAAASTDKETAPATEPPHTHTAAVSPPLAGEAWSSDSVEIESQSDSASEEADARESSGEQEESPS